MFMGKKIMFTALAVSFISTVYAADIEKGKALFNDPKFAGGTSGKSCNTCHPNGKGLENAGTKKKFSIMGQKQNSLEEAINFCIVNANKGKAIDVKSEDMKNIVAYIKSLGKK
jgi:cytochrome c